MLCAREVSLLCEQPLLVFKLVERCRRRAAMLQTRIDTRAERRRASRAAIEQALVTSGVVWRLVKIGTDRRCDINTYDNEHDDDIIDNGDGTYDVSYRLRPGRYVLAVRLAGDDDAIIVGTSSRYIVQCIEWLAATRSSLVGVGAVGPLTPGAEASFTLIARDVRGEPLRVGGAAITASVTIGGVRRGAVVRDNGDGTYVGRFVVPSTASAGVALLDVMLGGASFMPTRRVIINASSSSSIDTSVDVHIGSTVVESLDAQGRLSLIEGVPQRVIVRTHNAARQPLVVGGEPLSASLIATHVPGTLDALTFDLDVVDRGDGSYAVVALVPSMIGAGVQWTLRMTHGVATLDTPVIVANSDSLYGSASRAHAMSSSSSSSSVIADNANTWSYAFGSLFASPVGVGAALRGALAVQPAFAVDTVAQATARA